MDIYLLPYSAYSPIDDAWNQCVVREIGKIVYNARLGEMITFEDLHWLTGLSTVRIIHYLIQHFQHQFQKMGSSVIPCMHTSMTTDWSRVNDGKPPMTGKLRISAQIRKVIPTPQTHQQYQHMEKFNSAPLNETSRDLGAWQHNEATLVLILVITYDPHPGEIIKRYKSKEVPVRITVNNLNVDSNDWNWQNRSFCNRIIAKAIDVTTRDHTRFQGYGI